MRDCILDLCRQFAEGTAVFLDIEQRVVAEAACAVVLAEQCALAFTAHGERFAVREHTRDRAHKPAGTVFLILHIFQQKGVSLPETHSYSAPYKPKNSMEPIYVPSNTHYP